MKNSRFNSIQHNILGFLVVFLIAGPTLAPAGNKQTTNNGIKEKEKIHIAADRLTIDNDAKFAEFTGSVKFIQGETVITADLLKIFFKGNLNALQNPSTGQDSIEKIIATGNVHIKLDELTALADRAEFISKTGVVVLSGKNSKVLQGNNSISGSKITYFRSDGRVTVESGAQKRVEAVIFTGQQGKP